MIEWFTSLDPAIISAYAAGIAAGAAAVVALLQFFVGLRQSSAALKSAEAAMLAAENAGTHSIAASRQNWINNVIETLSEYHALQLAVATDAPSDATDRKRMRALRTKLEILLNPEEQDTVDLLLAADEIYRARKEGNDPASEDLILVARKLLKQEWIRIKHELGPKT